MDIIRSQTSTNRIIFILLLISGGTFLGCTAPEMPEEKLSTSVPPFTPANPTFEIVTQKNLMNEGGTLEIELVYLGQEKFTSIMWEITNENDLSTDQQSNFSIATETSIIFNAPDVKLDTVFTINIEGAVEGGGVIRDSIQVTVKNVNTAPEILSILPNTSAVLLGGQISIASKVYDSEGDQLIFDWRAENGSIIGDGNEVTYQSSTNPDFTGIDKISLTVRDEDLSTSIEIPIMVLQPESLDQWEQTSGPFGGLINHIEIDPSNPDILYAAGGGGVIFRSDNGGEFWKKTLRFLSPDEEILEIYLFPETPTKLYVVASEVLYLVLESGFRWQRLLDQICAFDVHPFDSKKIVVATCDSRVRYSDNTGGNWINLTGNLPRGYYPTIAFGLDEYIWIGSRNWVYGNLYVTRNFGKSWDEVDVGDRKDTQIYSIYVDPIDPNLVFVGLENVFDVQFEELAFVKTEDNGESWDPIRVALSDHRISLIQRPSNGEKYYMGNGGIIYQSSNEGDSWSNINIITDGDLHDIAVDPRDSNVIYLPGTNGVAKSLDGGKSWEFVNQGITNVGVSLIDVPDSNRYSWIYASSARGEGTFFSRDFGESWINLNKFGIAHPFTDELVVSPLNSNIIWNVGDIGDVFVSENGGGFWHTLIDTNDDGFRFGSVYSMTAAPSSPNIIYALKNGFGLFKSTNRGEGWSFLHQSGIDYSYSLAVDPRNADILYSGYNPKPFEDYGMVRQTLDGGETWRTSLYVEGASGIPAVVVNPQDPDTVYAGSTGERGLLWVSRDTGETWNILNESLSFTNVRAIATDPVSANIAYAGLWGGGLYKTVDGGLTWNEIKNSPTISPVEILISSSDPNLIYLADRTSPKVFRTIDGGETWETYFEAENEYSRILAATLSPSDPNILYVTTLHKNSPFSGDTFRLSGQNQFEILGKLPRVASAIAVSALDSQLVYAILHAGGVYRSLNGGRDWNLISGQESGLPQEPAIGYTNLYLPPKETDVLYLLGGEDLLNEDLIPTGADPEIMNSVYKSSDGGNTWVSLNDGNLGENSGTLKEMVISPINSDLLYVAASNGAFISLDGGTSWQDANSGLSYRELGGIGINNDGTKLYVGTLGGGVYRATINPGGIGLVWQSKSNLDAWIQHIQILVDPTNKDIIYASAYPGGIYKSTDGGINWADINRGFPSFEVNDPFREGYYSMSISSTNPQIIFLGLFGIGLFRTDNGGEFWLPMNGESHELQGSNIYSVLVDPEDENNIFVSSEDGVFRSLDGGNNWADFSNGFEVPSVRSLAMNSDGLLYAGTLGYEVYKYSKTDESWNQTSGFADFGTRWPIWDRNLYQYTAILFHPEDEQQIIMGTFPAGIYKSYDSGDTWYERNVNWTNDGLFSLTSHPENPNIVYAGTYNGINRSLDFGETWESWDAGWPPEQWVYSIDFDPSNTDIMYAVSKSGENKGEGGENSPLGYVMKSLDGGEIWFPIVNGLDTRQEFYRITTDRLVPDVVYLATQFEGVFISLDGGASWNPWNDGLSNPVSGTNGNNVTNIMKLSPDGMFIYFGSDGSGVFRRVTLGGGELLDTNDP